MTSKARLESNQWLRIHASAIEGRVLSIGSGYDEDGEGSKYRHYFVNCSSYTTSEVSSEFGRDLVLDVCNMLEIDDESFDCVFCSGVLEHVDDYRVALGEITRILKENGVLLLGLPFRQALHMPPNDYWRFTEYGIRHLLDTHQYKIEDLASIDESIEGFPAAYWVKAVTREIVNRSVSKPLNTFFNWQDIAESCQQHEIENMRSFDPDLKKIIDQKEIKNIRKWEYCVLLKSFKSDFNNMRVLDIGCGKSLFSLYLARLGADVITLDLPTPLQQQDFAIEKRIRGGVKHIHGSMLQLPFETASFDLVVNVSAIEHLQETMGNPLVARPYFDFVKDTRLALREMARVVKDKGYIYITSDLYDPSPARNR